MKHMKKRAVGTRIGKIVLGSIKILFLTTFTIAVSVLFIDAIGGFAAGMPTAVYMAGVVGVIGLWAFWVSEDILEFIIDGKMASNDSYSLRKDERQAMMAELKAELGLGKVHGNVQINASGTAKF